MEANYTVRSTQILQEAKNIALLRQHAEISEIHVLFALLENLSPNIKTILETFLVDQSQLYSEVENALNHLQSQKGLSKLYMGRGYQTLLLHAVEIAKSLSVPLVGTHHLLLAILKLENSPASYLLGSYGLDFNNLFQYVNGQKGQSSFSENLKADSRHILLQYGRDLTDEASQNLLDPVIGLDEQLNRLIQILSRRNKNNPLIIGEPGVGKSALVESLAQKIANGEVPQFLRNRMIYSLRISDILAGAKLRGEFEERFQEILSIIIASNRQIILFIDEIHTIMGSGAGTSGIDTANMLKPILARGQISLIGATTTSEYSRSIRMDRAMERRFQTIYLEEPDVHQTMAILNGIKSAIENYHGLSISDEAVLQAVMLSNRYLTYRRQPDKAIDLLDEACALVKSRLETEPNNITNTRNKLKELEYQKLIVETDISQNFSVEELERKRITISDEIIRLNKQYHDLLMGWKKDLARLEKMSQIRQKIAQVKFRIRQSEMKDGFHNAAQLRQKDLATLVKDLQILEQDDLGFSFEGQVQVDHIKAVVSQMTGIPSSSFEQDEMKKVLRMSDWLKNRIFGQNHIIDFISDHFKNALVGIRENDKPLASFLLLGPTGVGKTFLAKLLAQYLFTHKDALVRLDMSEFMDKNSVSKLIGSPPGYIGYEEGGRLTEAVLHRPFSLVLFDEIEKAHPLVLNLLLQLLDDGQLTDAKGRRVDFSNTLIILTSNEKALSDSRLKDTNRVRKAMAHIFKPELVNRLDGVLEFSQLDASAVTSIIQASLDKMTQNLVINLGGISVSKELERYIHHTLAIDLFGAREIERFIAQNLAPVLTDYILSDKIDPQDRVCFDIKDGKIQLTIEERKEN